MLNTVGDIYVQRLEMALVGTVSGSNGTSNTAVTGTLVVANVTSPYPTLPSDVIVFIAGSALVNNDLVTSGSLRSMNSIGSEGGEVFLNKSATGTTINTGITVDSYQDKLRIFETGGTNRGGYFDITALGTGVSSNLFYTGSFATYTTSVGSPFTLAIPTDASRIEIEICGAGGGGGGGGKYPAVNGSYGGGGGSGGCYSYNVLNATTIRALSSNLTISIGAGGTAGTAQTADNNPGGNGGTGGQTTVAAGGTTILFALGGAGGAGGSNTSGKGGVISWKDAGAPGSDSSLTASPLKPLIGGYAGGGGAGAGLSTAAGEFNGASGGNGGDIRIDGLNRAGGGGVAGGARNGGNANVSATYTPTGGNGGGGGASRAGGGAAGDGGAGIHGGGGGGGGSNILSAGNNSGAGGKGGDGWCIVRFR